MILDDCVISAMLIIPDVFLLSSAFFTDRVSVNFEDSSASMMHLLHCYTFLHTVCLPTQ